MDQELGFIMDQSECQSELSQLSDEQPQSIQIDCVDTESDDIQDSPIRVNERNPFYNNRQRLEILFEDQDIMTRW